MLLHASQTNVGADGTRSQTQAINSDLLSILPDSLFPPAKKADLTLAFNPYHPQVWRVWQEVQERHPGMCFSQMSDAYTGLLVLPCGIEVKRQEATWTKHYSNWRFGLPPVSRNCAL